MAATRRTVRYIIVPEIGGLAHLPDDPEELART
jgi:hypothetical protein